MESASSTMSAVPQTDGQAKLPKRIAPSGKIIKNCKPDIANNGCNVATSL